MAGDNQWLLVNRRRLRQVARTRRWRSIVWLMHSPCVSNGATHRLPKFELYEEGSQLRRSSKRVSSQIVEGHALRQYKAEYIHYLARAYASAEETIEHLVNLDETGSAAAVADDCRNLIREYATLSRKLFNYMRAVEQGHDPQRGR